MYTRPVWRAFRRDVSQEKGRPGGGGNAAAAAGRVPTCVASSCSRCSSARVSSRWGSGWRANHLPTNRKRGRQGRVRHAARDAARHAARDAGVGRGRLRGLEELRGPRNGAAETRAWEQAVPVHVGHRVREEHRQEALVLRRQRPRGLRGGRGWGAVRGRGWRAVKTGKGPGSLDKHKRAGAGSCGATSVASQGEQIRKGRTKGGLYAMRHCHGGNALTTSQSTPLNPLHPLPPRSVAPLPHIARHSLRNTPSPPHPH